MQHDFNHKRFFENQIPKLIIGAIIVLILCLVSLCTKAQTADSANVNGALPLLHTKFAAFTSKTGVIVRYVDYNSDDIRKGGGYNFSTTKIRKVIIQGETQYYYQVDDDNIRIEYSDIVEINKALQELNKQSQEDVTSNHDYIENRFVTNDLFEIGYTVSKGKANWFYSKGSFSNYVFFKNKDDLFKAFQNVQLKIEEIKSSNK